MGDSRSRSLRIQRIADDIIDCAEGTGAADYYGGLTLALAAYLHSAFPRSPEVALRTHMGNIEALLEDLGRRELDEPLVMIS